VLGHDALELGRPQSHTSFRLQLPVEIAIVADVRVNERTWTKDLVVDAALLCAACTILGARMRRVSGVAPVPSTDTRIRREVPIGSFGAKGYRYLIVLRQERDDDIGVIKAYGPNWETTCITPTQAYAACVEHSKGLEPLGMSA
jgi:hypothetical protein